MAATFKGPRIINSHSVETPGRGSLAFGNFFDGDIYFGFTIKSQLQL